MDSEIAARLQRYTSGLPTGPLDSNVAVQDDMTNLRLGACLTDEIIIEQVSSALTTARKALDVVSDSAGAFCAEIERLAGDTASLQSHSVALHARHAARTAAQAKLDPLVRRYVVPAAVVRELVNHHVGTSQYRSALAAAIRLAPSTIVAAEDDTETELELDSETESDAPGSKSRKAAGLERDSSEFTVLLLLQAAQRIKEFYVSKVRALRRPGADTASLRRQLIDNAPLFAFLRQRHPKLAATLQKAYINTTRWYYHMLLGKYLRNLNRAQLAAVIEPSAKSTSIGASLGTLFCSAGAAGAAATRPGIVVKPQTSSTGQPASAPTVLAIQDLSPPPQGGFAPEVIVYSLLASVFEATTNEWAVHERAFGCDSRASEAAIHLVFEALITHAKSILSRILQHSHQDILGLLLISRIAEQYTLPTNQAATAEAPSTTSTLFSDLCKSVASDAKRALCTGLEHHARNIEQAANKASNLTVQAPSAPHSLTPALAASLAGFLQLCDGEDASNASIFAAPLHQITSAYEMFIARAAKSSSVPETAMFNNYFIVTTMLSDVQGELAAELTQHFRLLSEIHSKNQ